MFMLILALSLFSPAAGACDALCVDVQQVLDQAPQKFTSLKKGEPTSDILGKYWESSLVPTGFSACSVEETGSIRFTCRSAKLPPKSSRKSYDQIVASVQAAVPSSWTSWDEPTEGMFVAAKSFGPAKGQSVITIDLGDDPRIIHLSIESANATASAVSASACDDFCLRVKLMLYGKGEEIATVLGGQDPKLTSKNYRLAPAILAGTECNAMVKIKFTYRCEFGPENAEAIYKQLVARTTSTLPGWKALPIGETGMMFDDGVAEFKDHRNIQISYEQGGKGTFYLSRNDRPMDHLVD